MIYWYKLSRLLVEMSNCSFTEHYYPAKAARICRTARFETQSAYFNHFLQHTQVWSYGIHRSILLLSDKIKTKTVNVQELNILFIESQLWYCWPTSFVYAWIRSQGFPRPHCAFVVVSLLPVIFGRWTRPCASQIYLETWIYLPLKLTRAYQFYRS